MVDEHEELETPPVPKPHEGAEAGKLTDHWTLTKDAFVIHHFVPRTRLYEPNASTLPIPIEYIDVMRTTRTDLDSAQETFIEDIWFGNPNADKELSGKWTGTTTFPLLRTKPPQGQEWVDGQLREIRTSSRPPHVRSEEWSNLSKKGRKKAIE